MKLIIKFVNYVDDLNTVEFVIRAFLTLTFAFFLVVFLEQYTIIERPKPSIVQFLTTEDFVHNENQCYRTFFKKDIIVSIVPITCDGNSE